MMKKTQFLPDMALRNRSMPTDSAWTAGTLFHSVIRLLRIRGHCVLFPLIVLLTDTLTVLPAYGNALLPYFEHPPDESLRAAAFNDFLIGLSPVEIIVAAGCILVVVEAIFLVALVRTRRNHVDK